MRFMVLKDYPIEEIEFLKDKYNVVSSPLDDELVYEVDESLRERVKVLEDAGLLKEIKPDRIMDIERAEDIIPLTEQVEILQGGKVYLRVRLANHILYFTEDELMSPIGLKKRLLRMKKVLPVSGKEWQEILQYWMNIGVEVNEQSLEEVVVEKVLNYLTDCRIYTEKEQAMMPYTLYYSEESSDRVYCYIDELVERMEYGRRRKLRSILSEYVLGSSIQFYIYNQRRRFWAFSIEKCGINLDRQRYREEEEEGNGAEEKEELEAG